VPGQGVDVVQVVDDDHLAVDLTVVRGTAAHAAEHQRSDQHLPLRVSRRAVRLAELVEPVIAVTGGGDLVAVVRPERDVPSVVNSVAHLGQSRPDHVPERRLLRAEVAGLGPEVVRIGRIDATDDRTEAEETVRCGQTEQVVRILPGAERQAERGELFQHGALGLIQAGIRVATSARTNSVRDLLGFVLKDESRHGPDEERVGARHRHPLDRGHEALPDAGGVLGRTGCLEGATARPVQVAVDLAAAGVVIVGGHGLGELRRRSGVPVPHRVARITGLHGVAAAREGEPDRTVVRDRRVLLGREGRRVGVLEEATLPLLRRGKVDVEPDIGPLEVTGHPVMNHRRREVLLAVDHRIPVQRVHAVRRDLNRPARLGGGALRGRRECGPGG
jgi:hypothetical protein